MGACVFIIHPRDDRRCSVLLSSMPVPVGRRADVTPRTFQSPPVDVAQSTTTLLLYVKSRGPWVGCISQTLKGTLVRLTNFITTWLGGGRRSSD